MKSKTIKTKMEKQVEAEISNQHEEKTAQHEDNQHKTNLEKSAK